MDKKIILIIMIMLCLLTIFLFSNQNASKSESVSDEVSIKVAETIAKIKRKEITESQKETFAQKTRKLVRKSAHFSIYLLLGFLIYWTLTEYHCKHIFLYTLSICLFFACTDEIHQLFVMDRTARVFDVCIDTIGSVTGVFIFSFIHKLKNKSF